MKKNLLNFYADFNNDPPKLFQFRQHAMKRQIFFNTITGKRTYRSEKDKHAIPAHYVFLGNTFANLGNTELFFELNYIIKWYPDSGAWSMQIKNPKVDPEGLAGTELTKRAACMKAPSSHIGRITAREVVKLFNA